MPEEECWLNSRVEGWLCTVMILVLPYVAEWLAVSWLHTKKYPYAYLTTRSIGEFKSCEHRMINPFNITPCSYCTCDAEEVAFVR